MNQTALEWMVLGLALIDKNTLARIKDIDSDFFSKTPRTLHKALESRQSLLAWFKAEGVEIGDSEQPHDVLIRTAAEYGQQRRQVRIARIVSQAAQSMNAEEFDLFIAELVVKRLEVPTLKIAK